MNRPFHYAFKVTDIASTKAFYIDTLGAKEGRSTSSWIDFDFWGNQLSAHISTNIPPLDYCGKVDGVAVPIPHFGCIIPISEFKSLQHRLIEAQTTFIIEPQLRYAGEPEAQWTMFILDPSQNPIEFKAFEDENKMF